MRRVAFLCLLGTCLAGCGGDSAAIRTYGTGERVPTGALVYSVYDTHWYLTLGPPASPRVPVNRFLVVRMNISNNGATESSVPTLSLIDDDGQVINELADGTGVPDWMGTIRKIRPVESEKGTIAFDAPPRHYKLRVADESDQIVAYINLPLTVTTDEKGP
jgi:hypothetical protein